MPKRKSRYWIGEVNTDSTHPPPGTFAGSAEEIAETMSEKEVSPNGLGSAIKMVQYFINRSGKNLPDARRKELERAKKILQEKLAREKAETKQYLHTV